MPDLLPMIHAERGTLADYLATLGPDDWSHDTWCDKWNVQQLVGHLIAAANVTAPHFFIGLVKCGFSFDRFVDGDLRSFAEGSPDQVLQRFRGIITSDRTPPGPTYVALGEVMVHGEDIRRALGAPGEHPEEHLVTLADLYKKTGAPLHGKKRAAGLRFEATDTDWTTGDGPVVSGPTMSLIMAIVGREGALADCSGDGVDLLRTRATV